MVVTCSESVEKINDAIARKVGQQRYKIWFKNSTRLLLEDNYVKVGVPNLFIGGWIENHFADQIAAAVTEVTQQELKVIFTIDPELFGGQRRRPLDSQAESVINTTNPTVRSRRRPSYPRQINGRHKLEDFVVGPSNQLACNAAKAVVAEPGKQFNPLFIHGSCGLGKTHLIQGICFAVNEKHPHLNVLYVSGEESDRQIKLRAERLSLPGKGVFLLPET